MKPRMFRAWIWFLYLLTGPLTVIFYTLPNCMSVRVTWWGFSYRSERRRQRALVRHIIEERLADHASVGGR